MRTRLRKRDRVAQAGKGCNKAQWGFGNVKRAEKVFNTTTKDSPESIARWAEKHHQRRLCDQIMH